MKYLVPHYALLTTDFLSKKSYEYITIAISNSFLDIAIFNSLTDNCYSFVVIVRSSEKTVLLGFQKIYEPNENRAKLTSLSFMTLYRAINKKVDSLQAISTTHSLLDPSKSFTYNQELQKVLVFNS